MAIIAFAAGAIAGCADPEFRCSSSAECSGDRDDGFCEPNGYCSFEDPDCDSGRRYGELAGEALAFQCVSVHSAATSSDSGPSNATDSGSDTGSLTPGTASPADDTGGGTASAVTDFGDMAGTGSSTTTESSSEDSTDDAPSTTGESLSMSFGERRSADVQGVTQDTFLSTWLPIDNSGTHADLHLHGDGEYWEVVLMQFDISALPGGASIAGATLYVYSKDLVEAGQITLHTLNVPWSEGTGDVDPGEPNWTLVAPLQSWSLPGAQGDAHNDKAVGSFEVSDPNTEYAIALDPAAVQSWADAPAENHGLVFQTLEVQDAIHLASSESVFPGQEPLLVVRYLP